MASLFQSFLDYEASFNAQDAIEFTRRHAEIPVIFLGLYLVAVFQLPELLGGKHRKGWHIKPLFAAWNLVLSIFSIIGAYRVVPTLLTNLQSEGFEYTVCTPPAKWYLHGAPGFWMVRVKKN